MSIGRFTWERRVIGPDGPKSSTTRLVLLVVATHVHRRNTECWPSLRTLAEECALSVRSVLDQLQLAVKQGWLTKTFTRNERMNTKEMSIDSRSQVVNVLHQ